MTHDDSSSAARRKLRAIAARAMATVLGFLAAGALGAEPPGSSSAASTPGAQQDPARPAVVAVVNGEPISRNELAQECLRHYGKDVLERLVNKYLIMQECQARGIAVTQQEVNEEITRLAGRFGLPVDQWLKMLQEERGIDPAQYANDIIWPTLALRKLAGSRLEVTPQEIQEQYETEYGPAVQARLIVCNDLKKAQAVLAQAKANPDDFGNLAKNQSDDYNTASTKGLINPIRKHTGYKEIEEVAFRLKENEVSDLIQVGDQYAILKCERHLPPRQVTLEQARARLEELVRDRKLRRAAQEVFTELQNRAKVENVLNDPAKSRQMPGVAAVINGRQVLLHELGELCIERHGKEVLEGTINRKLLEQACKKQNITVSEAELDQEIARAASQMVKPKPDGSPDVEAWLKMATEEQGISVDVYRRDSVWPSVALKKLVGDKVEVTEEDIRRGFEANYGPRVRCLAIVLDNQRRAQQVWEMARKNLTPEYFGELASQYSIETGSRTLRGEVPPIQKYGGQPLLENEAFALKPNELSSIIQVDRDRFVILMCLGRTEPVAVEMAQVRNYIYEDIHEKKLRIAMAQRFHTLQENATIDNFLAGTSQSPQTAGKGTGSAKR